MSARHSPGRRSARRAGYDTRWDKASKEFLAANPWCVYCAQQGKREPATCVDHIKPHRGDRQLFWNRRNWQGLCGPHHNATKKREESRGHGVGCDENGMPLDPAHHWRRTPKGGG